MGNDKNERTPHERWAEFRFSLIGGLLASPPPKGELQGEIQKLANKKWVHPITGELTTFGFSTVEKYFYLARNERLHPIDVLRRKSRFDDGQFRSLDQVTIDLLKKQYQEHPSWSYKLHFDNLKVLAKDGTPSYSTVHRYMKSSGLFKRKRMRKKSPGQIRAENAFESREVRGFENEFSNGLWHLDYHHCSRPILTKSGEWKTPVAVAIMDDHSRLGCHVQWYLDENTKNLSHAFSQALQKRGLPRGLLTDNGAPMTSAEFTQGLSRLSIFHNTTLPFSPWQNGKQERFFGQLERRLMDMLENKKELSLKELNDFTIVWLEMEYNSSKHEEIAETPIERFSRDKYVGRISPGQGELKLFFCREEGRTQRKNDGTISVDSKRFEIPDRYRHIRRVWIRFAGWDLSSIHLVDKKRGQILCSIFPTDKYRNAEQGRKPRNPETKHAIIETPRDEVAPLLGKYMQEFKEKGLPFPYLTQDENL